MLLLSQAWLFASKREILHSESELGESWWVVRVCVAEGSVCQGSESLCHPDPLPPCSFVFFCQEPADTCPER